MYYCLKMWKKRKKYLNQGDASEDSQISISSSRLWSSVLVNDLNLTDLHADVCFQGLALRLHHRGEVIAAVSGHRSKLSLCSDYSSEETWEG